MRQVNGVYTQHVNCRHGLVAIRCRQRVALAQ
jgi:hypothetical protein